MSAPWCSEQRGACAAEALAKARRVTERFPQGWQGHVLVARALAASGDARDAMLLLARAAGRVDEPGRLALQQVSIAEDVGTAEELNSAVDALARVGCATEAECVRNWGVAASVEARRGRLEQALKHYQRGTQRYPDNEMMAERVAVTATQLGLHAHALDVYERLARKHPEAPRYAEGATRARAALGGGGVQRTLGR